MARTYKKRSKKICKKRSKKMCKKMSKKMPKKMSKKMLRYRRKITGRGPFDRTKPPEPTDICYMCQDVLDDLTTVTLICCGHHLHTTCLNDLKNSQAFNNPNNRKCGMCRKNCLQFQQTITVNDEVIIKNVELIMGKYLPTELATQENIDRMIMRCKLWLETRGPINPNVIMFNLISYLIII